MTTMTSLGSAFMMARFLHGGKFVSDCVIREVHSHDILAYCKCWKKAVSVNDFLTVLAHIVVCDWAYSV